MTLITVEVSENGQRVEIILDNEGVDELIEFVSSARVDGDAHLRAPSWAGTELQEDHASLEGDVTLAKDLTIRVFV
ncbi:hypothetical protein [Tateyamaria sp. SN3-11]|uniref:hypothetical protein n=1 Tax=Tateyamaria sp. SN3-11 TaxID=3092147 RepID=UPI0039E94064